MDGLHGRRALVTGGASGIGREISRQLAGSGCSVAVADLPGDNLDAAGAELGSPHLCVETDVRSAADVRAAVERAGAAFGGLDTLVLSAGVIHVKPLAEVTEADWDQTLAVNLRGAFLCAQAAAPALTASGRGRIVAIASDAGKRAAPLLHAYSASKFGLVGLVQSLAGELAPHVTANAVCPVSTPGTGMGRMLTAWKAERSGRSTDEVVSQIGAQFPLGRTCSEQDVAGVTLFLISDQASFITGVALDVDGGAALATIPGAG